MWAGKLGAELSWELLVHGRLGARIRDTRRLQGWEAGPATEHTVWLHGASAGELLGAQPIVEALRDRMGGDGVRLLITYTSPSARKVVERLSPQMACFAPLLNKRCRAAITVVRPELLVLAKHDVWPGMVRSAARAGVPVALVNGTVRARSRRTKRLPRALFRATYGAIDVAGAVSSADAARLVKLGIPSERIHVTGDAAFDTAFAHAARAGAAEMVRRLEDRFPPLDPGGVRLIAGSTWPSDEAAVLQALAEPVFADWQVMLAPHLPTPARVEGLLHLCRSRGRPASRWSTLGSEALDQPRTIVYDEVGGLADLYLGGTLAYVGGGLDGRGLHNTLEPAAAGLPVVFGARHDRTDAWELEAAGGALSARRATLGLAFGQAAAHMTAMKRSARAFVAAGSGAAKRSADLLAPFLEHRPPP